ncbi:MAG: aminotransferase class IV [Deltaproteobacteria bacterium]|nr:aminotransferase class IV [Deltaproteobacteria bacterium]
MLDPLEPIDRADAKELCFLESIKWARNRYHNLPFHVARIERTWGQYFGGAPGFELAQALPRDLGPDLIKVRLVYNQARYTVTHAPYSFPVLKTAELVKSDLYYGEKFVDRGELNALKAQSQADEILIVQDGQITDCSIANLVFAEGTGRLVSPKKCLLPGVKRAALLAAKKIELAVIRPGDLDKYARVSLINAMIDLEDAIEIPVERIFGERV